MIRYIFFILVAVALGGFFDAACADDHGFYIQDGKTLFFHPYGNPDDIKPSEWQVRLYKRGQSTGGNDNWGLISEKSASKVLETLKKDQDFERRWEKWCGCSWGADTHFNPLGPIAVIKKPLLSKQIFDAYDKSIEIYLRARDIQKKYQLLILGKEQKNNQFSGIGKVIKEYMEQFRDVFRKKAVLDRIMATTNGIASHEMVTAFDELNRSLGALNAKQGAMQDGTNGGGWYAPDAIYTSKNPLTGYSSSTDASGHTTSSGYTSPLHNNSIRAYPAVENGYMSIQYGWQSDSYEGSRKVAVNSGSYSAFVSIGALNFEHIKMSAVITSDPVTQEFVQSPLFQVRIPAEDESVTVTYTDGTEIKTDYVSLYYSNESIAKDAVVNFNSLIKSESGERTQSELIITKNPDIPLAKFANMKRAVLSGDAIVARQLLEKQHFLSDLHDSDGRTVVHFAAQSGNVEIINAVLTSARNIYMRDNAGRTVFDNAYLPTNPDLQQPFIRRRAQDALESWKSKRPIAVQDVKNLLSESISPNDKNSHGTSLGALILAETSVSELEAVLDYLVVRGFDINAHSDDGHTAVELFVKNHDMSCENWGRSLSYFHAKGANFEKIQLLQSTKC